MRRRKPLRSGGILVVRALDRIAGTEPVAIKTISDRHERGIQINSLTKPDIGTTTAMGRALFSSVASFTLPRVRMTLR